MIRHVRWLAKQVPLLGTGAVGLAVYAEPDEGGALRHRAASESGYEGVACVDDAARAAVLLCRMRRAGSAGWTARAARGFLAFVLGMQEPDGRFANFILDWNGTRNTTGPTSQLGGHWWTARALHALAAGYATLGDPGYAHAFRRALTRLQPDQIGSGAAAQGALAAIEFWRASGDPAAAHLATALVDVVLGARIDGVLVDDADPEPAHLWGRYQELALVEVGSALRRSDLVRTARVSAENTLAPAAAELRSRVPALPYEASCLARGLASVATATGMSDYRGLADLARAWFTGVNAAGLPIYDPVLGRVYDGVDGRSDCASRSRNAGAEANVEAGLALLLV